MNTDAPGTASPFGTINGRYVLEEIVGSGGMGVVYRGRDTVLDRSVAVKMIRQELAGEEFVRRFEREAAILARLRSPHIVVVYDYGRHADKFFLVTDYLSDGDLENWLSQHGPMPPEQAVRLLAQLAEGLADAHAHGVIHRDVKPANTLLWRRGEELRPVLADFGIAVAADLSLTAPGAVIGSPLYMAPERHVGSPATAASDIYSMGCLLFTLLTGNPPYYGTEYQAAQSHLNDPIPKLPPKIPHARELDRVIATCMAKAPEDRFPSADALATELGALASRFVNAPESTDQPAVERGSGAVTTVMSTPVKPRAEPESRRRPGWPVLVAVVGVLMVAGLAWWLVPDGDRSENPPAADLPVESDPSLVPPPDPGRVDARSTPEDLGVRFEVGVPDSPDGVEYEVERNLDGWQETEPEFVVSTRQGGERACANLRLMATGEGGRTAGPARELCARAKPRRMALTHLPGAPCEFSDPAYSALSCGYFNLAIWGFRPDQQFLVTTLVDNSKQATRSGSIATSAVGKGMLGPHEDDDGQYLPGGLRVWSEADTLTVRIDGQEEVFDLAEVRAGS